MAPSSTPVKSRKQPDPPLPGPGDYDVPSELESRSSPVSRRNVMGSTAPRFDLVEKHVSDTPSPGHYNISGSLLKPSYNIFLS